MPANTSLWPNDDLMLAHVSTSGPIFKPTLGQRIVSAVILRFCNAFFYCYDVMSHKRFYIIWSIIQLQIMYQLYMLGFLLYMCEAICE